MPVMQQNASLASSHVPSVSHLYFSHPFTWKDIIKNISMRLQRNLDKPHYKGNIAMTAAII
jgi:hypothetical protein